MVWFLAIAVQIQTAERPGSSIRRRRAADITKYLAPRELCDIVRATAPENASMYTQALNAKDATPRPVEDAGRMVAFQARWLETSSRFGNGLVLALSTLSADGRAHVATATLRGPR